MNSAKRFIWKFYRERGRLWKWTKKDVISETKVSSKEKFQDIQTCVLDAMKNGYKNNKNIPQS